MSETANGLRLQVPTKNLAYSYLLKYLQIDYTPNYMLMALGAKTSRTKMPISLGTYTIRMRNPKSFKIDKYHASSIDHIITSDFSDNGTHTYVIGRSKRQSSDKYEISGFGMDTRNLDSSWIKSLNL